MLLLRRSCSVVLPPVQPESAAASPTARAQVPSSPAATLSHVLQSPDAKSLNAALAEYILDDLQATVTALMNPIADSITLYNGS